MRSSETTSSSFSKKGFGGFVSKVTILYYYFYLTEMVYKFLSSTSELHIMFLTLYLAAIFFFFHWLQAKRFPRGIKDTGPGPGLYQFLLQLLL